MWRPVLLDQFRIKEDNMTSKTQEKIDQIIEKSGDRYPPEFQKLIKNNFARIIDNQMMPKEAFNLPDDFVEFGYKQAYNLFQAGKFREAVKIFDMLIMLDAKDIRFTLGAAACHQHLKDYSIAGAYYLLAKELDPLSPIPSFHLYDCFMKLNQPIPASYELERVIVLSEQDPKYSEMRERALLEKPGVMEKIKTYVDENIDTLTKK